MRVASMGGFGCALAGKYKGAADMVDTESPAVAASVKCEVCLREVPRAEAHSAEGTASAC